MAKKEKDALDSKKTHERIMECALSLFQEKGYQKVTLQEICRKAGITKSTFYYHYSSKEELIKDYTDQVSRTSQEDFSQILMMDTHMKQLWSLFVRYIQKNNTYGAAIVNQVYSSVLNSGDDQDFPEELSLFPTVSALIQKAQEAGEITNMQTPEALAAALYYGSRGINFSWAAQNGEFSLEERTKQLFNTVLIPQDDKKL